MDAHEGDGGHLVAYGVEGVSAVIEAVVDDEPSVMRFIAPFIYLYRLDIGLAVVLVAKACHACSYACGVYLRRDSVCTDIEHVECFGINVGIDDDGTMLGCLYQLLQCHTCGEEVTIEEYHLGWRCVGADEEVELFVMLLQFVFYSY